MKTSGFKIKIQGKGMETSKKRGNYSELLSRSFSERKSFVKVQRKSLPESLSAFEPLKNGNALNENHSATKQGTSDIQNSLGRIDKRSRFGRTQKIKGNDDFTSQIAFYAIRKTPQKPTSTPQKPTSTPQKSTSTPQKKTSTPQKPTSAPQKPTSAPQKLTSAPQKPTSAPQKPTSAPQKPTSTPQKIEIVPKTTKYESPIEKLIHKNKMIIGKEAQETTKARKSESTSVPVSESFSNGFRSISPNQNGMDSYNGFLNCPDDFQNNSSNTNNFFRNIKSPSSRSTDSAKGSSIDLEIDFPIKTGDILWGRIAPFPYWPCMVWPDPNGRTLVLNNNTAQRQNVKIHVRFFGDNGRRSWVYKSNILPYNGRMEFEKRSEEYRKKFSKKHTLHRAFLVNYKQKKPWEGAVTEANEVNECLLEDRLKMFEKILQRNRELMTNERSQKEDLTAKQQNTKRRRSSEVESLNSDIVSVKRQKFGDSFNTSDNSQQEDAFFTTSEFKNFYEVLKRFVFQKNDHCLEEHLERNAKEIWYIRSLATDDGNEKRDIVNTRKLSLQFNELIQSENVSRKLPTFQEIPEVFDGAKTERKVPKAIEEVVEDILELSKNYLYKGMSKDLVCKECRRPSPNLVKCLGKCQALLHKNCESSARKLHITGDVEEIRKNLTAISGTNEPICSECASGEFPKCFVCKENATNTENIIKCHINWCTNHYHLRCLKLWPQSKITKSSAKVESLLCPAHVCHTCVSDDPRGKFFQIDKLKLVRCVECPATYHLDSFCIPAGTKFLATTQIICPRHGKHEKLNVNANWCFICAAGGSLICCDTCPTAFHLDCLKITQPDGNYICEECETGRLPLYGELVWAKLGNYRWWPAIIIPPPEVPKNLQSKKHEWSEFCIRFFGTNDYTWINRNRVFLYQEGDWGKVSNTKGINQSYKQGLEEAKKISEILKKRKQLKTNPKKDKGLAPLPYTKIKSNRPVPPVKLQEVDISELTPCECSPIDEDPCGLYSGCLNRLLMTECNPKVCPAGSKCQNQLFEKRLYPPLKVCHTNGRGWGLICEKEIKSGTFVIEYVGEVIDDSEFQRRIAQKQEEKDENYYFLTLEKDWIIDAGPKGNLARFMNHSCEPNCETQKWTVNGITRIGLFAITDVPADTELTFNYNLECLGDNKKICHCGSEKCSGFIGSKYKEPEKQPPKVKSLSKGKHKSRKQKSGF